MTSLIDCIWGAYCWTCNNETQLRLPGYVGTMDLQGFAYSPSLLKWCSQITGDKEEILYSQWKNIIVFIATCRKYYSAYGKNMIYVKVFQPKNCAIDC